MFNALKSLFVHEACYCCRNLLTSQEKSVCMTCLAQLPPTHFHLSPQENELYYRLAGRIPIKGAMSFYYFDKKGRLQHLIRQLKYHDAPEIGEHLGNMYAEVLASCSWIDNLDAILAVPLHWKKKIIRGYNQSDFFAKGLAHKLSLPVYPDILSRNKFTLTQTKLSGSQRWSNVKTAFSFTPPVNLPENILLVDDVITTGATLEACVRAILNNPAYQPGIYIASIAMARIG